MVSLLVVSLLAVAVAAYFGFVRGYLNRYGDTAQDAIPYTGRKAGRVVVLGCSIAGMATAKAVAPFFEEVIVLERDTLPSLTADRAETLRGGAAHAPLSHLLLNGGQTILEHLFGPVLFSELLRIGCAKFDICSTMVWNFFGAWKCRAEPNTGMSGWSGSRFAYEQTIRRVLLKDTPNLKLIQQAKNATPIFSQSSPTQRAQLTGVKWNEGKEECTVSCDLMIDATGRSTNLLKWLAPIHVGGAKEEDNTWVDAGVSYTSFVCARDASDKNLGVPAPDGRQDLEFTALVVYENHDVGNNRHFLMWPIENDRYQLSLGGLNNDQCPTDWEGALEYSKGLADPIAHTVLKRLKPVQWDSATPIKSAGYLYNVPRSTKRPLERMTNFPAGLHVVGDAACCFNPIFGQGMSMATIAAITLQREIKTSLKGANGTPAQHLQSIQAGVDRTRAHFWFATFDAWSLTAVEDTRWAFATTNSHWFWRASYRALQPISRAFQMSGCMSVSSFLAFVDIAQMVRSLFYLFHPVVIGTIAYHAVLRECFGVKTVAENRLARVAPAAAATGKKQA